MKWGTDVEQTEVPRMVFREVSVTEVREILRLWLRGEGYRSIARLTVLIARRCGATWGAAVAAGLGREGGEGQLSDELVGEVVAAVRPARPYGRGVAWEAMAAHREDVRGWLEDDGLTVVKVHDLLARRGVAVPYRTLCRFAAEELGFRRVRERRCGWRIPTRAVSCRWTSGA
jgi:ribosomal protein L40E